MNPIDAATSISNSEFFVHSMLIYSNLTVLRLFYSNYIKKRLEENNEVVQMLPFYETVQNVRDVLTRNLSSFDVNLLEMFEKSLIIIDSAKMFLNKKKFNESDLSEEMVTYSKILKKKGVSVLSDKSAFIFANQLNQVIEYELNIPDHFYINFRNICLYHQKDFAKFTDEQRQLLVDNHNVSVLI